MTMSYRRVMLLFMGASDGWQSSLAIGLVLVTDLYAIKALILRFSR